nr:SH3 domain-containing protein [Myxococcus sp. MH1]
MKTSLLPTIALSSFALLHAPLALAGDEPLVKAASVDLNGDGKPEDISLETQEGPKGFGYVLKVGAATVNVRSDAEVHGFVIIDIDSGDPRKEVAVHTGMTDHDSASTLYAFDGKALKSLGSVRSPIEAKGNNIILSSTWQSFWTRVDKYVLDAKAGKLDHVPQEFYFVGQEAKVRESFPIFQQRTTSKPVAQLATGSTIQVLLAVPVTVPSGVKGNQKVKAHAFLVKSSTGLVGWVSESVLSSKTEGLPFAG